MGTDFPALKDTGLMNLKSVDKLMNFNVKLLADQEKPLSSPKKYKRLVRKLNYFTFTYHDISFEVNVKVDFLIHHVQIIEMF